MKRTAVRFWAVVLMLACSGVTGWADELPNGPYESEGVLAKNLTKSAALGVCNGHFDDVRGYHYHVTPGRFPYILGGYAGVVESSHNRGLRGGQTVGLVDKAKTEWIK